MRVQRPRPGVLVLQQSRTKAAFTCTFLLSFLGFWYWVLLAGTGEPSFRPQLLMFWLAPLLMVPEIVRTVKVLVSGEVFTLDSTSGLIERNDVRVAHFSEVERVQIRRIHDSEGSDEFRLSIVLTSGEKLRIDQSTDSDDISAVAEDIADLVGAEVYRKSPSRRLSLALGGD